MSEQDQEQDLATIESQDQELEINLDDTENVEAEARTYTEEQFRQVVARAKKAEAELKATKHRPAEATQTLETKGLSEETIQAMILQSKGVDVELISEMKPLAKLRGKSVLEMENDPIYLAMKKEREDKVKAEKAKLGASRGSGQAKQEKSINSQGLSDEEHKAMWREMKDK